VRRKHTRGPGIVRLGIRFLPFALRRWPALLAVASTMLIQIGLTLLAPWTMKVLVDNVLYGKPLGPAAADAFAALPGPETRNALLYWTLGAGFVTFFVGWAAGLAGSYANIAFSQRLVYDLGARLFDHLQRLSLRFHNEHGVGNLIRRITTDTTCISSIVSGAFIPAVVAVVTLVTMFLVMWALDPLLTLLSLAVIPILLLALRLYGRPMAERSYENNIAEGDMYDTVEQTVSAIPVVHAFAGEEAADRSFRAVTDRVLRTTIASTNVELRFSILTGFATAAGTAAILWLGARHALDGEVTVGTLVVFLAYLAALYSPLHDLTATGTTLQEAAGSAWRVTEILDAKPEVHDGAGATPLGLVEGHIAIENVRFAYEPGRPALRGVSLEAHPGEVVAVVGATGAGKSTLVSLVPRFFDPDEGRVLVDGRDVRDVQLRSLREQVSLVLQESFLFPISIAENIAYGRPDASRSQIEAAARAANAHAFIEALSDGYDTVLGERGATLSGGERQRIAIARALLKNAPILILDEPTSALDAETESLLLEALDRLMAGRTTLIIAHRLSTIRNADRVVVIDDGRVVEEDTPSRLLERKGVYARLHAIQTGSATP